MNSDFTPEGSFGIAQEEKSDQKYDWFGRGECDVNGLHAVVGSAVLIIDFVR